jgi:hypothetical protein
MWSCRSSEKPAAPVEEVVVDEKKPTKKVTLRLDPTPVTRNHRLHTSTTSQGASQAQTKRVQQQEPIVQAWKPPLDPALLDFFTEVRFSLDYLALFCSDIARLRHRCAKLQQNSSRTNRSFSAPLPQLSQHGSNSTLLYANASELRCDWHTDLVAHSPSP